MTYRAKVTAVGSYVPDTILSNADLEKMVDTNDEWIVQRTGIRERRVAGPDQFTSDLSIEAVNRMLARYPGTVEDVDLVIVCTNTPDYPFPSTACRVQNHFGMKAAGAMDLNATCAGFVYGLHTANALILSGLHRKVLVIGADTMSKITDYRDRSTCILFGDGAGAALVERTEGESGFLASFLDSDGSGGRHVYRAGLSETMEGVPLENAPYVVQNGREVYKWAVSTVPGGMHRLAEQAGLALTEAEWFIPHSANLRMIESICEKSGFPLERTLVSMIRNGNTSAASIPLALDEGLREGRIQTGDRLLLYGFGGGLVQAGLLLRWG
ncbi:ketoacyl-ACP synthase III [Paenibacillus aurantius]|uniref:Beta-ketoacyl-[acyl-carrier-protein] synthase III n=1 Tax=Paenibacillus aurantius TaxID=2918900 RepID=A0AA96RH19_9BACL|nr:ketoacyl-ACP synthase III [Paenibacillus aurantius]WNQ12898.1 ketoacyl-ACP synthase III [Paenibacillus aurantius]